MEQFHPLESWLGRSDAVPLRAPSQPLNLQQTSRAWTAVRQLAQLTPGTSPCPPALTSLPQIEYLRMHRFLLHISDANARALSALLGKVAAVAAEFPGPSDWDSAGQCALLLLAVWVRRLLPAPAALSGQARINTQAGDLLSSVVANLTQNSSLLHNRCSAAAILLVGSICASPTCPEPTRDLARKLLVVKAEGPPGLHITNDLPELLAGFGYGMSASHGADVEALFSALLSMWTSRRTQPHGPKPVQAQFESASLRDIHPLLKLMEYEGARLLNEGRVRGREGGWPSTALDDLRRLSNVCLRATGIQSRYASLVAAGGLLRGLAEGNTWQQRRREVATDEDVDWLPIQEELRALIVQSAADACPWVIPKREGPGGRVELRPGFRVMVPRGRMTWLPPPPLAWAPLLDSHELGPNESEAEFTRARDARHWLRTVCVVVTNLCSPGGSGLEAHPNLLWCCAAGLLGDALQIRGGGTQGVSTAAAGGFNTEAPGLTRALCDLLAVAPEGDRGAVVETILWFSQAFQRTQCQVAKVPQPAPDTPTPSPSPSPATTLGHSAFLSTFLLLRATLPEDPGGPEPHKPLRWPHAVSALHALALLDFWRVEAPLYGQLVGRAVGQVAREERAVEELVGRMPPYGEVVSGAAPHAAAWPTGVEADARWHSDAIQVASCFYWLRLLQPCLPQMNPALFSDRVAPLLFLYLHHPRSEVSLSAHSLFSAFLRTHFPEPSSNLLKEQLAVYYTERCLQGYPDSVPFKALVPGVGTIAQHLPPGSPAVALCITAIADKCRALSTAADKGGAVRTGGSSTGDGGQVAIDSERLEEGSKQLQSLLSFLIPVVDIQILPLLLHEVASLLLSLTASGRPPTPPLSQLFQILSSSDDYTRKPLTVPFFQTLAYLATKQGGGLPGGRRKGTGGGSEGKIPAVAPLARL